MTNETKTRAVAALAGVFTGVMLIGTTGLTFMVGWVLWGVGLCVLLAALPPENGNGPRRGRKRRASARSRDSLVG